MNVERRCNMGVFDAAGASTTFCKDSTPLSISFNPPTRSRTSIRMPRLTSLSPAINKAQFAAAKPSFSPAISLRLETSPVKPDCVIALFNSRQGAEALSLDMPCQADQRTLAKMTLSTAKAM